MEQLKFKKISFEDLPNLSELDNQENFSIKKNFATSKQDVIEENEITFDGKKYQEQLDKIYKKVEDAINDRFRNSKVYYKYENLSDIVKMEPPDLSSGKCEKDKNGDFYIPSYLNLQIPSNQKDIDGCDIKYKGEALKRSDLKEITDEISRCCIPYIKNLMKKCRFIDSIETDVKDFYFILWVNIKKMVGVRVKDFSDIRDKISELRNFGNVFDKITLHGTEAQVIPDDKNVTEKTSQELPQVVNPDLKNYINSLLRKYYLIGHGKKRTVTDLEKYIRSIITNGMQIAKTQYFPSDMNIVYTLCALHEFGVGLLQNREIYSKLRRTLTDEQIKEVINAEKTGQGKYAEILAKAKETAYKIK